MAGRVAKTEDVIAEINIIPFVDIVLVLLIIFMVTSTAIVKAAIKVDLPRAAAAGSEVNATVNVVYTKEKVLYLDGKEMGQDAVAAEVARRAKENPALQAVISADTSLPYGDVVQIVDMVKLAGVNTFALNIERKADADR